jgi:molecular chaperone DnaK
LVGLPARRQAVVNASNTVFAFKWLIGRKSNDKEVKEDAAHWYVSHNLNVICVDPVCRPFAIVNKEGRPAIEIDIDGKKR